jgi:hypothetical protein
MSDKQWETLTTASAVVEAVKAGRQVQVRRAEGEPWGASQAVDKYEIRESMRYGRVYRALIEPAQPASDAVPAKVEVDHAASGRDRTVYRIAEPDCAAAAADDAEPPQDWAGVDGAVAWHLIDRHADSWDATGKAMDAWLQANAARAVSAPASDDVEAMLRDCVPGGSVCDPQQVADAIREWYAARAAAPKADAPAEVEALAREGLEYFERAGDAGDRKYVAAIREALARRLRPVVEHTWTPEDIQAFARGYKADVPNAKLTVHGINAGLAALAAALNPEGRSDG